MILSRTLSGMFLALGALQREEEDKSGKSLKKWENPDKIGKSQGQRTLQDY